MKKMEVALKRDQAFAGKAEDVSQEIERRRTSVQKYKPGESMEFSELTFPDILNIGLFGTTGIGKTSLLNSLKYAMDGELRYLHREQVAPVDFQGGHTGRRQAVRLTKHITFIDNRGVGAEDLGAPGNTEEMIRQLEGRSSFVQPIVWRENPAKKLNITKQCHRQQIYCAVLVFDARKSKTYFEVARKCVECLFRWQGRFPIAVVTNVDRATAEDLDNMSLVLGSTGITDIYKVANISPDKEHLEDKCQLSLLRMIEKCMGDGDRIYELRTQIEEVHSGSLDIPHGLDEVNQELQHVEKQIERLLTKQQRLLQSKDQLEVQTSRLNELSLQTGSTDWEKSGPGDGPRNKSESAEKQMDNEANVQTSNPEQQLINKNQHESLFHSSVEVNVRFDVNTSAAGKSQVFFELCLEQCANKEIICQMNLSGDEVKPGTNRAQKPTDSPAVTDAHLLIISKGLSPDNFPDLYVALGIQSSIAQGILTQNTHNYRQTYMQLLQQWKTKSHRTLADLDQVLVNAEAGGLRYTYK